MSPDCSAPDCGKPTSGKLQCPTCLKADVHSYFCDQACFKRAWAKHKTSHKTDDYDPFPPSVYTGSVHALYPLSPRRPVDADIPLPDYAADGQPTSEQRKGRLATSCRCLSPQEIETLRGVCRDAREILDEAAAAVRPGITTDELDEIVHNASMKRKGYPSPLNYYNFPKSVCTSVNEVVCHGIPDRRVLQDGDIVNLDISFYKNGFHSDLNETYYVGEKAKADKSLVNLVETAREALDKAIATVKPGTLFRSFGDVIEPYATAHGTSVVRTYCGHGINDLFHCAPNVPHYAKNKTPGICKPGMTFTIEPMINEGSYRDKMWPDGWTSTTADGKRSAQFEHMLLVTEDGVEVLTARLPNSPGGPIPRLP